VRAMKTVKWAVLILFLVTVAAAQSIEPPLADTRISVNTLVREDIFAGFVADDMERFSRGEKSIKTLLETRSTQRAELLSWKGGATLYRAVRALEDNRKDEFQQDYRQAVDLFSQAYKLEPNGGGSSAIIGGSYLLFADRLPNEDRAAAWSEAYDNYRTLWKFQSAGVAGLPVHLRGELLGGLAQSAQRTGHTQELTQYLDKILEVLPNTPYERVAKKWKSNPESAAKTSITCLTCHDAGRLAASLAR
jgi:tetratricopeptide (TPR) repeat protein